MSSASNQKVTVSLPPDAIRYADTYQEQHGLSSRSEVLSIALKLLREKELAEGYAAMAQDQNELNDPWLDSDLNETLTSIEKG